MDDAGIFYKMFKTVYTVAAGVIPMALSPIHNLQSIKRVGECIDPADHGFWSDYQHNPFYQSIGSDEFEKLTDTLNDLQLFSNVDTKAAGMYLARGSFYLNN